MPGQITLGFSKDGYDKRTISEDKIGFEVIVGGRSDASTCGTGGVSGTRGPLVH